MAVDAVRDFTLGPLFTPPTRPIEGEIRGTLMRPPNEGTVGWGGADMDPATGILYAPSRNRVAVISLYQPDPAIGATVRYTHGAPKAERMANLAARRRTGPQMPQGLPQLKPPYSRITAIDMSTGDHVWVTPTGAGDRCRRHPPASRPRPPAAPEHEEVVLQLFDLDDHFALLLTRRDDERQRADRHQHAKNDPSPHAMPPDRKTLCTNQNAPATMTTTEPA